MYRRIRSSESRWRRMKTDCAISKELTLTITTNDYFYSTAYQVRIPRVRKLAMPKPKVALIFLPGVLGTDLGEAWPCTNELQMLQCWLENTTATVKLLTSPTLQVKPSSKPDGSESIPDIYEPFIKFCQTQNSIASRVFDLEFRAVGYIWTQSNLASAEL
jgi:hypothetical protein